MKKIATLLTLLVASFGTCLADQQAAPEQQEALEQNSFGYGAFGTGPILLIPNGALGFRGRSGHHGFDTNISASTLGYIHMFQVSADYLYYTKATRPDSWYVGAGVSPGLYLSNEGRSAFTIAPELVFGKQLQSDEGSRHFVEARIQEPTFVLSHRRPVCYFPLMYVRYGIGF